MGVAAALLHELGSSYSHIAYFVRKAGNSSSGLGFVRSSSALPLTLPPPLRPPPLHYPTPASAGHHIASERAAIQDTEESMGMRWKYIMLVLPTMAGEVLLLYMCSWVQKHQYLDDLFSILLD
jgi:hypothetical protein